MPADFFVLIPLGGLGIAALFMVGMYKLLSRWLDQRHGAALPEQVREEIERLRHQLGAMEALPERLTELEERVDFAERLLARQGSRTPELEG